VRVSISPDPAKGPRFSHGRRLRRQDVNQRPRRARACGRRRRGARRPNHHASASEPGLRALETSRRAAAAAAAAVQSVVACGETILGNGGTGESRRPAQRQRRQRGRIYERCSPHGTRSVSNDPSELTHGRMGVREWIDRQLSVDDDRQTVPSLNTLAASSS
jgi:hypothetical protein